jgi:type IV fimbrial biogenesis protein FimT
MQPRNRRRHTGFTLLELMASITVLGILLALAVPTFTQTIRNNQLTAQNNEFVGALNYARSEAIKRSADVSLCSTTDGTTCAASLNWATGVVVFLDVNANGSLDAATDTVLQAYPATVNSITLTSTTGNYVRYTSTGMSSGSETFTLQRTGCTQDNARRITVSLTGRITTTRIVCT